VSGGLHVDHVHLDSDHHAQHTDPASARELAVDHEGDDAVSLSWIGSEATPKRALPCLTVSVISGEAPRAPAAGILSRTGEPSPAPRLDARPPGRAPPA